jgi:hypothetical protein
MNRVMAGSRRLLRESLSLFALLTVVGCSVISRSPQSPPVETAALSAAVETVVFELSPPTPTPTNVPKEEYTPEGSPTHTGTPAEAPIHPTGAPIINAPASPTPGEADAPTPTPTPSPEPKPTPTMEVIFQDNFDATRGWYTYESDRFRMEYLSGKYHIYNNFLNAAVNSVRTQNHADIYLEVEAARVSGPPNGYFGLVCRFQDDNNYYALVIGSDGSYGIIRMTGGSVQFISPPPRPTEIIRGGFSVNRIGGSCVGDKLTLYVNGVKMVEATDDVYSSGFIGLVVGTTSVPGLEVSFDNYVVRKPEK